MRDSNECSTGYSKILYSTCRMVSLSVVCESDRRDQKRNEEHSFGRSFSDCIVSIVSFGANPRWFVSMVHVWLYLSCRTAYDPGNRVLLCQSIYFGRIYGFIGMAVVFLWVEMAVWAEYTGKKSAADCCLCALHSGDVLSGKTIDNSWYTEAGDMERNGICSGNCSINFCIQQSQLSVSGITVFRIYFTGYF